MRNENNNGAALPIANMEQLIVSASVGKKQVKSFDSPVSISIHSIRKRLADPDGISAKAVIDGIVHAGILQDDSPEEVKNVTYSQEKGAVEITIITITDED